MTGSVFAVGGYGLSFLSVAVLVTAVVVVVLGLFPFLRRESLQESLFFFLLCLAIGIWLFGFCWVYSAPDPDTARRWVRLVYLGIPLIPAALFTVAVHSLGVADDRRGWLAGLWLAAAVFVVLTAATDVIIDGMTRYSWGFYPTYTPAGGLFVAYVAVGLGASLREYWKRYRKATRPGERTRARMYLLAFGTGCLAVVDFLPCYGVDVYPGGYLAILAMSALIGYTLRRHRLTEITPAFAADRILATITDPVIVCDTEGRVRLINDAVARTLGYDPESLVGEAFERLLHDEDGSAAGWTDVLEREEISDEELVLATRDEERVEVSVSSSVVLDVEGRRVGTAVVARDIRERKALEDQLRHQALHDPLTGLPNRALFEDRLGMLLHGTKRREDRTIGVLYLDLNRFKTINDSYGHSTGDAVLERVAERIGTVIRDGDTAARLGGDEFAVALGDLAGADADAEAREVCQRLVESIGTPMEADGVELHLSCSVGVATAGSDGENSPRGIIRRADLAMYHAKSALRDQIAVFEPGLAAAADRRTRIEQDMDGAVGRGELRLVFHPVLELTRNRPVGLEALLRWEHPELGRLLPADFIPVAEETGRIVELGRWALFEACRRLAGWRRSSEAAGDLRVMVNVSEAEITAESYPDLVAAALSESGLPADSLELEITERMVAADPGIMDSNLRKIREMGVHVTIDDFGTGTSSLRMVRRLELDGLKIDRTFIHRLADDLRGRKFVQSILELARELGLRVVAEGVEEDQDLGALRDLGIECAQGFLWSQPLEPEDVPEFLSRSGPSSS